jgi:hypothetical protein
VHFPKCTDAVRIIRIWVFHLLAPVVEQLGVLTEDSLGDGGIKIIIHAPPSYEHGVTMINVSDGPDQPGVKQEQCDELELTAAWEAFVGSFTSSEPNLAERTEEILRAELGRGISAGQQRPS